VTFCCLLAWQLLITGMVMVVASLLI
jgi:hypothetical protein